MKTYKVKELIGTTNAITYVLANVLSSYLNKNVNKEDSIILDFEGIKIFSDDFMTTLKEKVSFNSSGNKGITIKGLDQVSV